ncbi:MAG: hypothetical protein EBU96_01340 [Actinobacteria bacterium]|nr:hypothetical protein [Actinomycetota bacterium]
MKLSSVIIEARRLLQDNVVPYRYSDPVLLGFANQALKRMAVLRPDLFAYLTTIPTTAGTNIQSIPSDGIRIMEIFQVDGGNAVTEASRESLDETYPGWMNVAAGECVNIYPKAPTGQTLIAEYAQAPRDYTADEDVALLSDAYFPVVLDGTVYLAETIDNEHVNSNRAQLFQQTFTQALGVSAQARTLTDTEESGLPKEQVI